MKRIDLTVGVLISLALLSSCNKSKVTRAIENELASGVKYDSLFLNFKFGDTREQFFANGWEQNKKNLIAQGPENRNIQYILTPEDSTKSRILMLFYPDFDTDLKVKKMDLQFGYMSWAPWNPQFFSDSLMFAIQDTLMSWYGGNEFLLIPKKEKRTKDVWVKVDGNRLISLAIKNDQRIEGYIKDMSHPDNMKK
ncbi:MAG: hypothetical protein RIC35_23410 [Marinoscillum sp.]